MDSRRMLITGDLIDQVLVRIPREHQGLSFQPTPGVQIFLIENYYFRTNSNLMAAIITSMRDNTTCEVEIVSGGGGSGLAGMDWGSESAMVDTLCKTIERICKECGQIAVYR